MFTANLLKSGILSSIIVTVDIIYDIPPKL
jgi:hypothetical protein